MQSSAVQMLTQIVYSLIIDSLLVTTIQLSICPDAYTTSLISHGLYGWKAFTVGMDVQYVKTSEHSNWQVELENMKVSVSNRDNILQ